MTSMRCGAAIGTIAFVEIGAAGEAEVCSGIVEPSGHLWGAFRVGVLSGRLTLVIPVSRKEVSPSHELCIVGQFLSSQAYRTPSIDRFHVYG
jgi:hypothetical protein